MISEELLHGDEKRRKKQSFSWGKEMNKHFNRQTRLCACVWARMCVGRAGKAQQQGMP